jgi:hypothetical protein
MLKIIKCMWKVVKEVYCGYRIWHSLGDFFDNND